jgi:mannose-1-phosphate guanylyltransferase
MIIPVILSGGSGTRLWPLSRTLFPKQFISLMNDTTLFQDTILRLPEDLSDPLVICNEEHRFLVAEQLRQIGSNNSGIILEPIGKNTAPAIALAALKLIDNSQDPSLLVLSADHLINDNKAFQKAINIAKTYSEQGKLVAFGVKPTKPETGYGYIEVDSSLDTKCYDIQSFKEKPNLTNAKNYLDSGNYYWNSGIFMFKASEYLDELNKFEPEILSICRKSYKKTDKDLDFLRINNKEFNNCPEKSIDYAVMEKTKDGVVIPLESNWSDIGSWDALWEAKPKDDNNNVSTGDVILEKVTNSYIQGTNRLLSVIGLSDIVVIDTEDAILVADKKNVQNIKNIVEKLKNEKRGEIINHRKVYRPWGYYDSIDSGQGFQVKRISVNPCSKLSLQKHQHRSEHWVVINGIAQVTCGKKVFELKENQSAYIPKGEIHRLENREKTPLEIIEIQTGDYLGEDDIIRLEDDYERN